MTDQGPFTNLEVFLDVLGAFCNEAMTRSKIESIAIVQYTIHLTVVVIYAAYSGVLISSLTVNRFEAPIQTLEEFAKDSSYRMGVLDDSAYYYIFRNATDKVVHQIYEHKIKVETSLPQTFAEGIRRVCNEDNYAFLSAQPLISQWKSPNCILKSSETIFAASICMGMHKSSPFRGGTNHSSTTPQCGSINCFSPRELPPQPFISLDNKILQQNSKNFFVFFDDSDQLKIQLMKQLIPLIDISDPVWLIFFNDDTEIKNYFVDVYIPFNCRFMISQKNSSSSNNSTIITEIYQVDKYTELRYNIFGSWNPDYGFQLPTFTLYRRRSNLYGHLMRIAVLDSTPGSTIVMDEQRGIRIGGIFGAVVDILQERMNFTPAYHVVSEYGSRLQNGTWTGGVGSLVYNICDIFPTNLRMVSARLEAIQFTTPLYLTRDCFFFKKPLSTLSWNLFLTPFSESIWIIIPCLIIITSSIIALIIFFYKRNRFLTLVETNALRISDVFLDVFGAFCGQGMPKSTIASINVVQFTTHLTAIIILAAYSGILTSSLTINNFVAPFATMEGFIKDGSYRMGVLGNSAYYDFFQNAADEITKEIFVKKILTEASLPQTFAEGLERVCLEKNYAFLSSDLPAAKFRMKNCILLASEAVFVASLAIGLPQNNPYRGLIDRHIFILRDSGVLHKIIDDWTNTPPTKAEDEAKTVEFYNILPLMTLLIFHKNKIKLYLQEI
ncbi:uncharacterized protein [Chelonus insularis]|uniref:uncharacterized protein n=1 Tax=Chelonus insularis TaxID=460826 RepID=UPI00158DC505|nr:uncharacterized protein LOC118067628 [Chelonus insularis]